MNSHTERRLKSDSRRLTSDGSIGRKCRDAALFKATQLSYHYSVLGTPLEKSLIHQLVVALAPEFGGLLKIFNDKYGGWVRMPEEMEQLRKNSGLGDHYVIGYEDERRIPDWLQKLHFPENTAESSQAFEEEFSSASFEERSDLVEELLTAAQNPDLDLALPETEEEKEAAMAEFKSMSEEDQKKAVRNAQLFCAFFYAYLFNCLSLMVHGQKLTTLVPRAMEGDKEVFCKAVQIDRNLLTGNTYFRETYSRLVTGTDPDFWKSVSYRIANPTLRTKIRFPLLFMVFAVLESFDALDDFTASEILDICDEAGLDRFQNCIEDETYLTKRRIEYRKMQKNPA